MLIDKEQIFWNQVGCGYLIVDLVDEPNYASILQDPNNDS